MINNINRQIYKQIKKYDNIIIARHIGADPDALGSQLVLRELIKNKFKEKSLKCFRRSQERRGRCSEDS